MQNPPFDTRTHHEHGLMQGFPPPPEKQVNRLNGLWGVPHNRWAYQNMRRLLPSASIKTAETPVDLQRQPDAGIAELTVQREDRTSASFDEFLRETFTDSLVVLKGGKVVFETYLNGMTSAQPHQMMSCTKSFVGLMALMAIDDGAMVENAPVNGLVPELPASGAFGSANLRHLLDMTNSMHFSEDYDDPEAHIHDYARIVGLGLGTHHDIASDNLCDYLTTLEMERDLPHGTTFHYQTPKTDVLNWATNRATGQSFAVAMHDRLWSKLGTNGETYVLQDPSGNPVAGGGLNATPEDLARFAAMMLAGGKFEGQTVVPERLIETLEAGGSRQAFMNGPDAAGSMSDGCWSYRGQWWVRGTPGREAIMALGVNGQWIYIDRNSDVAFVKQSSQPVAVLDYFDTYTLNAFDAVIDHLAGR